MDYELMMRQALDVASISGSEVPVGAIVFDGNSVPLAKATNLREAELDIAGHAELRAIQQTIRHLGRRNLSGLTLVSTLEPCPMCAFAARESRISRLIFGAYDSRYGSAGSRYDILRDRRIGPPVETIGGILEDECSTLIRLRFKGIRQAKSQRLS
jgi:tRNA(adenine34) deaminase